MKGMILFIFLFTTIVSSQTLDYEVGKIINMLEQGQVNEAIDNSKQLISANPNHPAILYLKGRLETDGIEAVKLYQLIMENHPKSQWADDALFQIYQYYYALGLYRTAEIKMNQLLTEYPNSPYLVKGKTLEDTKIVESKEQTPKIEIPKQEKPISEIVSHTVDTSEIIYTVQVGAYSILKNAEEQKYFFEKAGYKNVIVADRVRGGRTLFLVWVGNYNKLEEAIKIAYEIKEKFKIETLTVKNF